VHLACILRALVSRASQQDAERRPSPGGNRRRSRLLALRCMGLFGIRPIRLRDVFVPSQTWAIKQQRNMVEDVPAENATLLVDDQVLAFEEALQE